MATRKPKAAQGGELVPAPPMEFRKTNEAIGLRVREGKLSLLTRKVFNVMMYHAQELKDPGVNAPIDTPSAKKYFWMRLSDLARDAHYDSKDTEFLKAQLEELQNIKLLMENERQWTSERLVASVTLVNPMGLKKHSGQVWFGFAFPPEVHELVMAPGTYTKFSIFYQGLLRSGSSLALYEICRRYATNPSKLTLVEAYEHWYGVLSGNPVTPDNPPPLYKYFKRDVIRPAIAEINALTDIQVELIEHRVGRRVERIQFRVEHTKQPQLDFAAPPVIDLELMGKIMKFGLSQSEAADVMAQHGDDKVRNAVSFVQTRIEHKNSAKLDSPAAYFRWSLKQGAAAAKDLQLQQSSVKGAPPKKGEGPSIMEKFLAARAQEALAVYKELDDDDRKAIFGRFRDQNTNSGVKLDRGIDNATARSLFSNWYAQELWGEPTVESLAHFVEQFSLGPR